MFSRSPAAYEALKSFNYYNYHPVRHYNHIQEYQPGASHDCIAEQVSQYLLHCEKLKTDGKKESQKVGVMIFDEVKVISRLMWKCSANILHFAIFMERLDNMSRTLKKSSVLF